MPAIPPFVLKKLYVKGSLQSNERGFISLRLSNVIAPGTITGIAGLTLDGRSVDLAKVKVTSSTGDVRWANELSIQTPLQFPLGCEVKLDADGERLDPGPHRLAIRVIVRDAGPLEIPITDTLV